MILNLDGEDHINVYSKGLTSLGRKLSNFAHTPFRFGNKTFASVEAWWFWRQCEDDLLLPLYGWDAKNFGQLRTGHLHFPDPTKEELLEVYLQKLKDNPSILWEMKRNALPYDHYYVYGGKRIYPKHRWTGLLWNEIDVTQM